MKNGSRVGHADEDEKGSRKMTERDRQALLRVRSQARLVRELSERLEDAEAAAIPGRQMDGMPRGKGGMPRGLEMKLMLKESLEKSLEREEKRLHEYEKEAREAMIGMKSGAYAFCLYYYICGMNLEDVTRMTDRCERQIRRYKREIEKGNEENGEADWDRKKCPADVRAMSEKCPPNVRLRYGKKCGMISSVKEEKGSRFRKEAAFLMGLKGRRRMVVF